MHPCSYSNIPTMQFFTRISRDAKSKSFMQWLTECVWELGNCEILINMPYCVWEDWNHFSMKNVHLSGIRSLNHCTIAREPTTLPTCATMGVGTGKNWLGFNLVQMNYWPRVIFFCWVWLVCFFYQLGRPILHYTFLSNKSHAACPFVLSIQLWNECECECQCGMECDNVCCV